jgi:hypothetical protein
MIPVAIGSDGCPPAGRNCMPAVGAASSPLAGFAAEPDRRAGLRPAAFARGQSSRDCGRTSARPGMRAAPEVVAEATARREAMRFARLTAAADGAMNAW